MATAGELIKGSLRLLGVLAEGEEPSADSYADALLALQQMFDSWSTERLAVYCLQDQTFTWPAGQATRTVGASGNFVGTRPIALDPSTYYVVGGISYGLAFINADQYNSISVKATTTQIPEMMWVNPTNPNLTMTLWPVPSQDIQIHLMSVVPLSQPAATGTTLAFPPGYLRAFRYNLAVELAPEFGVEPSPTVKKVAATSKRNLRRINDPNDILVVPVTLIGAPRYNIVTDGY